MAFLSPQRQKEESAKVSSDVKAQGKGFLKSSAAIMQHWSNYYKKYYSMTSADILAEESENYAIEYGDINKILYRSETTDTDSDGQNYGHQGKIEISLSNGNKIKFTHTHHHDKKIKIMLLELFEEKLKYKK
ncbi:MAG TPA: hypothetical protein VFD08_05210 [Clostridia bacterium]|nr:hypothetical protein [Clostridia bacterium]